MSTARGKSRVSESAPSFLFGGDVGSVNYVVSDRLMHDFIDAVGASIWEYDFKKERFFYLEDKIARYDPNVTDFGIPSSHWKNIVHPDDFESVKNIWKEHGDSRQPFWFEYRERQEDGAWRWYISTVNRIDRDLSGKPMRAIGVRMEITRIKQEAIRRQRSEKQFRMIFNNVGIGIGIADQDGILKRVNPSWVQISGYSRRELLGKNILDFVSGEDRPELRGMIEKIRRLKMKRIVRQMRFINKDGSTDWEYITLTAHENGDGEYALIALMENINDQKKLEEQLQFAASHDALTGLLNRAFLSDRLEEYWALSSRHQRQLTFCMADLDHFKRINDKYGHQAGDEALRRFAAILKHEARGSDIVGRYGGEEFGVILPETDLAGAIPCFERIREQLKAEQIRHGNNVFTMTATFGLAALQSGWGVEDIIKKADQALYKGKAAGRDMIVAYQDNS
jgi:PAS domain S-box/diguanylate cyclase (GGDEF) domain